MTEYSDDTAAAGNEAGALYEDVSPDGNAGGGIGRKSKEKSKAVLHFAFTAEPDVLQGRYRFALDTPIPELDTLNAKAYTVYDERGGNEEVDLYGLVCENGIPYRMDALKQVAENKIEHAALMLPLGYGVLQLSMLKECRFVMVFHRPTGVRLSDLIAPKSIVTEKMVIKDVLVPLTQILQQFAEARLTHGKIHPKNIWYDEKKQTRLQVGECFSEPCGYSQSLYYEPFERMEAEPLGKGDGDSTVDYFAMGVLTVHLLLGFNPVQHLEREEYLGKCLANGLYNTIVGNREFSGMVEDLLKGLLADSAKERWDNLHMLKWLGGKKYNLLKPTPPREAPRPFTFRDTPYFNRRHLAHALYHNWNKAKTELREKKIQRWVELSVQNPELAEALGKIVDLTGGETGRLPTDDDDLVSKSITLLDPYGPFRLQRLSCHVDGMGPMLAEALRDDNKVNLHLIKRLLENDMIGMWSEMFETMPGYKAAAMVWSVEQRRHSFQLKSIGFGVERILYDLNPNLPCLSPIVAKHHPRTLTELMYSLNTIATEKRHTAADPMDAHIAAFLCSKMNQFKEVKTELDAHPRYKTRIQLKHLVILAQAQQKAGNPSLPKLTAWMAERIKPLIDLLHSRSLRKELKDELEKSVSKGSLTVLFRLIANAEVIRQDNEGYKRAVARYQRNAIRIAELNKRGTLEERAVGIGSRIAFFISFMALIGTAMSLINDYVIF